MAPTTNRTPANWTPSIKDTVIGHAKIEWTTPIAIISAHPDTEKITATTKIAAIRIPTIVPKDFIYVTSYYFLIQDPFFV
jgi:hypothetical protein